MYHKGDIKIENTSYDAREDDGYDEEYKFHSKNSIQLPHSCDNWIIGGVDEAEAMIEDLKEAIRNFREE